MQQAAYSSVHKIFTEKDYIPDHKISLRGMNAYKAFSPMIVKLNINDTKISGKSPLIWTK